MALGKLSSRAIIGEFYQRLEGLSNDWTDLISFDNFDSDQASEEYDFATMAPVMRQWLDGRKAKGLKVNQIEIVNDKFEATMDIPYDYIRRDKTGQIRLRIDDMARRTQTHWRSLISTLMINGTSTTIYDGQNYYSASHSEGDSGTHSNLLTASDYGTLNVATAAAPTPSEMNAALVDVINHFYGFKDDQGEPINEDAMEFLVVTPVNLAGSARSAINAGLLNNGSGSRDNELRFQNFNVTAQVNPRLTSTTAFHVFRTDSPWKPFIRQDEYGVQMSSKAEGSEYEHDTDHWQFGVKASRNAGYGAWSQAIHATLS